MDFKDNLCNSTLYEITKNPLKSVNNWSYTYDLYCDRDFYNVILYPEASDKPTLNKAVTQTYYDVAGGKTVKFECSAINLFK